MSSSPASACAVGAGAAPAPPFELLWTVGFSGKRFIEPAKEAEFVGVLDETLKDLCDKARRQCARLTAVSSLARGGDVLFAEAVRSLEGDCTGMAWKCLLPFPWRQFIRLDLAKGMDKRPLPLGEKKQRLRRAKDLLKVSLAEAEVVTSREIDPGRDQDREEAYLECGYRTVDEADVMIFLMREKEYLAFRDGRGLEAAATRAGTYAVACYAKAAQRPIIVFNVDAPNIKDSRMVRNDPNEEAQDTEKDLKSKRKVPEKPKKDWFFDPMVTEIVARAREIKMEKKDRAAAEKWTHQVKTWWYRCLALPQWLIRCLVLCKKMRLRKKRDAPHSEWTPARKNIREIKSQLGKLAGEHQSLTRWGLRWVLRFHLMASALAAIGATILVVEKIEPRLGFLILVAVLAFAKPLLAWLASWLEKFPKHKKHHEDWLNGRVLEELCRGALATWPLPLQPLKARDEEDFPKAKRMIRTLRLLREQDREAGKVTMREACQAYIVERLENQANYYEDKNLDAQADHIQWRLGFLTATWTAIGLGVILATEKTLCVFKCHWLGGGWERWLEAGIIIMPFVAAHCLNTMAILDTRRRCRKYEEMRHTLTRQMETLEKTEVDTSRLRLIEHAERTLIEEQHEWLSVMQNMSV